MSKSAEYGNLKNSNLFHKYLVTITQWSQLVIICIMGAMSPGPSLAVILRNTISGGRTQGVMSGIGHGLGITFYAVVAVVGLVAIINTIPHFYSIAQLAGSFFLIWLGGKMIISFFKNDYAPNKIMQSKYSAHQGFLEGFMIAILNPKIAAWLLALFSQFVQPNAHLAEQFVLVSTVGIIDASWYCLVAFLASSDKLLKGLQQNYSRIELGMGILLIILAVGMIWKAIPQII